MRHASLTLGNPQVKENPEKQRDSEQQTVVLGPKSAAESPDKGHSVPALGDQVRLAPSFRGTYVIRKSTDAVAESAKETLVDAESGPVGPEQAPDPPTKPVAPSECSDEEIEEIAMLENLLSEQDETTKSKSTGERTAWLDGPQPPNQVNVPGNLPDDSESSSKESVQK